MHGGPSPTPPYRIVAEGLRFPEGPVALPDGDLLVTEVRTGNIVRIAPDGSAAVVACVDRHGDRGGANGAALGPDGACYVTNNGGFRWGVRNGMELPFDPEGRGNEPDGFEGGRIDRVDLTTGEVTTLYDSCDGRPFRGPNDLVFDGHGGFWFTDMGKDLGRAMDKGSVHYATADGSSVREAVFGLLHPNGVGLSPDGRTLYVAETTTGRLWAWDVPEPGTIDPASRRCLANTLAHFDSLAVEEAGSVVVAAISDGLCVVAPDGSSVEFVSMPGPLCTNVCFGGADRRTAYVTLAGAGQLIAVDWPRPGAVLAH
jgi:gluconolactonase